PLDELHGVFANPPDRRPLQARQGLVLASPSDRLLRRVHMGDLGAGSGGDKRGNSRITEEVQHRERAVSTLDLLLHPLPVYDLLREHADMAKRGEAAKEIDAKQRQGPGFSQRLFRKAPASNAVLVRISGEYGIDLLPD